MIIILKKTRNLMEMKIMVKIYLEDENKTKEIGYKLGNLLTPGSVIRCV